MSSLQKIFESFNKQRVLIIGDVMIDAYMWGHVNRISPEAPVPIVAVHKKENRLGGAANVALNIQAMGATAILCAVIGEDAQGKQFLDLLKQQGLSKEGIISSKQRITTVKTRIIGSNHQMLRVDEEIESTIGNKEEKVLISRISDLIAAKKIDVIIFEDYDKGVISEQLIHKVVEIARKKNIPTVVDPKKKNFMNYKGVSLFKPNLKELKEGLKTDFDQDDLKKLSNAVDRFIRQQEIDTALITLSERGIYTHDKKVKELIPAHVRNISDVSGAGDTVVSVAALCLGAHLSPVITATLANLAGGLVCEKVGVVPINKKQLLKEAQQLNLKA